jgi:cell division protein FtsI (penicillin-binding protein 3)
MSVPVVPRRAALATPGVSSAARGRAYLATALVTLLLAGVAYKAWGLQVDHNAHFREQALRQHLHTVEIPAPRGPIVDARNRPLAVSADAESVWANPQAVVDVVATAEKLGKALGLDESVLEARLATGKQFAWIARRVRPEQAKAVRELHLAGIEVASEPRRWYPGRESGGPVIGFAGIDGNGLDGLELQMDELLTGQRARFAAVRDARGKTMLADGLVEATPGATVQLTLDSTIQHIADQALAAAIEENDAKGGTAVVLDVATGGVLAMASLPTYDPNDPAKALRARARNSAVTDSYEIGSIMKVFNIATALDLGVTRADETWATERGSWRMPGATITDVHGGWPSLTTAGVIKHSSNIGAAKIGLRLGATRLHAGLRNFGFGAVTGIELPGEQTGLVRDGTRWRDVDTAHIAYGYGVTVTPLQVAAAIASIGTGGVYHEPRLIERVTAADGTLAYQRQPSARVVIKPQTAATMREILASVFDRGEDAHDGGTAKDVVVPGFRAGGKTATAHKYDPATRHYALRRYLASFAGLVPIAAPRLAIVVVIDEPNPAKHYGGQVAGPVFGVIASEALRYLGVPGDAPIEGPRLTRWERLALEAKEARDAKAAARAAKAAAAAEAAAAAAAGEAGLDEIADAPDAELVDVPDFRGLSVGRALALARSRGLAVDVEGSGRCSEQDPPAGPSPTAAIKLIFVDPATPPPTPPATDKAKLKTSG